VTRFHPREWHRPRQWAGGRVHDIALTATADGCRVRLQDEGVHEAEAESVAAGWAGFLGKLKALAEERG
jgi:hypothetical protein